MNRDNTVPADRAPASHAARPPRLKLRTGVRAGLAYTDDGKTLA